MDNLSDRITVDSGVFNGKPTIRGKRITVQTIIEFLRAGETKEEILKQYPSLVSEDIDACLKFKPFTIDEFNQMIDQAESDSKNGRVISSQEMKKEIDSWGKDNRQNSKK